MKAKAIILLCVSLLTLVGCEENPGTPPYFGIKVVKFTDDKYRENILAEYITDSVRMRGSQPPVIEELIVGSNPFAVKLPNGYWVVDWRWQGIFIYPSSNVLLPDKWETLSHWNQTWELPVERLPFKKYIADYGIVTRRALDNLLGINLNVERWSSLDELLYESPWVWGCGYQTENDIPDDEKVLYYECVRQQDSLHTIYVQRLIEVINNGDFKKVYKH